MNCPSCNSEVADASRFCSSCGTELDSPDSPVTEPFERQAATPPPSGATPSSGLSGSDAAEHGRFLPGTMVAGRYRIVGLLGRGGMGEVYRADDLKLGQSVALKFLPERLADDPERLEYFHNEVRIARQVSHPNVCRVYDIGEVEGQHFLSMEHVDGEDLASLMRQIGRLPPDKGIEIARQLCAGLAAAHDKGVLHRDLKPANVMLDGRGRVRITDFGLARLKGQPDNAGVRAGTPAYMAPEQLAGHEATERSDLYSLGLVLFEVFTGKRPFQAETVDELARLQEESSPELPSSIISDIDPAVERAILRCLERDPRERPASALSVAAALPGGDPLAAALAVGETPSPEMVAAAGGACGVCRRVGAVWLVALLVGLCAAAALSDWATVLGRTRHEMKKPEVLEDKAREILRNSGYDKPDKGDWAYGLAYDEDYLQLLDKDRSPGRWDKLETGRPAVMYLWYRESPEGLSPVDSFLPGGLRASTVTFDAPPPLVPGMVSVRLDLQGRLLELHAVPREMARPAEAPEDPDWPKLFEFAGLDLAEFTATEPRWLPPVYADTRVAWEGRAADADKPVRVEGASHESRPVCFKVVWSDWATPKRKQPSEQRTPGTEIRSQSAMTIWDATMLIILIAAVVLARRNIRLGRSHLKGALRIALYVFASSMLVWLLGSSHVPNLGGELRLLFPTLAWNVYIATHLLLVYLALEPYVRRLWPEALISWSRLLAGRFRDPRVGRDLLIGAPVGVSWAILLYLAVLVASWIGAPAELERMGVPNTLLGIRHLVAQVLQQQQDAVVVSLYFLLVMLLLRSVLRNQWLAGGAFVLVFTLMTGLGSASLVLWLTMGACWVSFVWLMTRYGLVTLVAAFVSFRLLVIFPVTADFSAWYWDESLFALAAVAAIGAYGYYISLPGPTRPVDHLSESRA
ncbi:protein kinase [Planctomycetota bacterium]